MWQQPVRKIALGVSMAASSVAFCPQSTGPAQGELTPPSHGNTLPNSPHQDYVTAAPMQASGSLSGVNLPMYPGPVRWSGTSPTDRSMVAVALGVHGLILGAKLAQGAGVLGGGLAATAGVALGAGGYLSMTPGYTTINFNTTISRVLVAEDSGAQLIEIPEYPIPLTLPTRHPKVAAGDTMRVVFFVGSSGEVEMWRSVPSREHRRPSRRCREDTCA